MSKDLKSIIEEDRQNQKKESWSGTCLDYLELVKNNPDLCKLAHKRIYDRLMTDGVEEVNVQEDPRYKRLYRDSKLKIFNFFADQFYGMDKTISQIVRYFHSASLKGEESRQVLYLVGPVGSGKSSLVESIKKASRNLSLFTPLMAAP